MLRGEEPFIYDKKVLEEVCWQHAQTCLLISAIDEVYRYTLYCNLVSRTKHGTGHRCTPMNKSCVFIFKSVLYEYFTSLNFERVRL
jgi:hypothetical protein